MFPAWLRDEGLGVKVDGIQRRPNLSQNAETYLERIGAGVEDLLHHVFAVLHDPATRGQELAAPRPEIAEIAVPSSMDSGNMAGDDFAVTARWGHFGSGQAVMPNQGKVVERPYTPEERDAMGDTVSTLGETTYDIYPNERVYWCNVPANVWRYELGGYQVLKMWLSYRESKVLGRSLLPDDVQHFAETSRRHL